MKRIKVGQIGAAHDHAPDVLQSFLRQPNLFDVVGYAVPNDEPACAHPVFSKVPRMSINNLLNTPGLAAVAIETEEKNLSTYALEALEHGISVHMDKPGGLDYNLYKRVIDVARENNLVFHTGYMYRYNPAVKKLMDDIRNGRLGEIYSVEAHMDCFHPSTKRQWLSQFPGGMMFYLGCHLIDLIIQIQGLPDRIIPFNAATGIDGVLSNDLGMVVFKYPHGVSFAKSCCVEPGGYMRRQLVVCGSKGTVVLQPFEAFYDSTVNNDLYTGVREVFTDCTNWQNDGERHNTKPFDRFDTMMQKFAMYVLHEETNPYTYEYELNLYKTLLQCCEPERGLSI